MRKAVLILGFCGLAMASAMAQAMTEQGHHTEVVQTVDAASVQVADQVQALKVEPVEIGVGAGLLPSTIRQAHSAVAVGKERMRGKTMYANNRLQGTAETFKLTREPDRPGEEYWI